MKNSRTYWKSLERLEDSPVLTGEFPDGASLSPDGLARRRMLQLMGASFALAGLASCRRPEQTIVPFVEAPEDYIPGVAKHYASTMTLGGDAYGIVVESHEGRPTKIEGNELHPRSRGTSSAWMQAALLELYDPDRSSEVLKTLEPSSFGAFLDWWRPLALALEDTGGRGLSVLTESYRSPSFAKLARAFKERFPNASWHVVEPYGDENVYAGVELVTGAPRQLLPHLERASRILALDCDFLATETGALAHQRGFAAKRRDEPMSRLYAVESTLTVTGANADHRIPLRSSRIPLFLAHLAHSLGMNVPSVPELDSLGATIRLIAEDLAGAKGEALVLLGRHHSPEAHGAALAINAHLGALGSTLTLPKPVDTEWGSTKSLADLADAAKRGEVETLVMLGGNPVYDAPGDLDFAGALEKVETTVHLSGYVNETSKRVDWHLPRAHFLESWGDARAADGTPSIVQPLIAPLFGGRSSLELLGLLVADDHRDGFGLVRDGWIPGILGDEDVEPKWNRVLHDGLYAESPEPDADPVFVDEARAEQILGRLTRSQPEDGLELVFTLSPAVHDGRFGNNAWLQELPDPITKLTWGNALLVSPRTANRLNVATSELVVIEGVTAPVLVVPGLADDTLALSVGYGRSAAGRVGTGVGVDAYALRRAVSPFSRTGITVEKTSGQFPLAITQDHWSMEGRDLVREGIPPREEDHAASLFTEKTYEGDYQWGMVIDLAACQGCNACITACQAENNVPVVGKEQVLNGREMHWLRVDRYFSGEPESPDVFFQPVPCMHCENAPCEQVCPVGATLHDAEGINAMVYNRCIGTRYCSNNCPYKVRRFNFFNYTKDLPETLKMAMNPNVTVRSRGVMEKCTYCIQRLHESKRDGTTAVTACQQSCPAEAIVFGNLADRESDVSKLQTNERRYQLLEELYLKPRTSYLTVRVNPHPGWV